MFSTPAFVLARRLLALLACALVTTPALAQDSHITTPPGFEAELIYSPDPATQGSWVALCAGPDNALFAVDQYGALYRVEPPPLKGKGETGVARLDIDIEGAQGLCWAFDSLYVMATNRGLLRLTDTNADGTFDKQDLILAIAGEGEHGTHAIVVAPEGKSLLIAAGNHTPLPELTSSRCASPAREDVLVEREPDPRGHAVGKMAPGGFICRISPDGSDIELMGAGFRNTYDVGVSPEGEIFTFDSDMEWDIGLPWYRPARICHVVSGAEFGWRNGSAKWPPCYEDSVPSVVDIGPASPTGVIFATDAAFPERYRRALYCLDWTYGIIYAIHLSPDGASYAGDVEKFAFAKPWPLTDVAIGSDGAMYVTTGGRRLESALYRIVYRGTGASRGELKPESPTPEARLRRQLESFHRDGVPGAAIDVIWPALGSDDRFVRYAARVALEHQPIDRYLDRAVDEQDAGISIMALMAAARSADASHRADVTGALLAIDTDSLDTTRRLAWTRALSLAFMRLGAPEGAQRTLAIEALESQLPSGEQDLDTELVSLLAYLDDPDVVAKGVQLMQHASTEQPPAWGDLARMNDSYGVAIRDLLDRPPPLHALRLAYILRTVDVGWTMESREAYFAFLNRAEASGGGMSYQGYIDRIRNRAVETCSDDERAALAPLLQPVVLEDTHPPVVPKGLYRDWTAADATKVVDGYLTGRDFERGAGLYRTATCVACHQLGGAGASVGPDLTSVANTYSVHDLLRAILEPSNEVSSQYALSVVTLVSGEKVTGRIVDADDRAVHIALNVLDPDTTRQIDRTDITSIEPSTRSPMPAGLVNNFGPDDLRNLVAYVMSGANPDSPMFKP